MMNDAKLDSTEGNSNCWKFRLKDSIEYLVETLFISLIFIALMILGVGLFLYEVALAILDGIWNVIGRYILRLSKK